MLRRDIFMLRRRVSLLLVAVLLPGGQSAPDVPLRLVDLQHLLHLQIERPVKRRQTLGQIFVYGSHKLERFLAGQDRQSPEGKYPHCHPCPLQFFRQCA